MTIFHLPDLGEGLAEAEIVRWHVKPGEHVKVDQPMVAVETAKAVVEVPAPYTGVVKTLHGAPGDVIATGAPLIEFELADGAAAARDSGTVVGNMPTSEEELIETAVAGREIPAAQDRVRAAPAVRALAKRMGVDLASLQGSGRGGVVTLDDVMGAAPSSAVEKKAAPAAHWPDAEKLRGPRRAMTQSMSLSRDSVASCTLFDDADLHSWSPQEDLTFRLLRALGAACQAEPALNAWFDGAQQVRRLLSRVDVGIAVDTAEGLIVPVLRDVAGRNRDALRGELDRLKRAARERTLAPDDMRDFSIMLSNFGMIAGRYATPVVVPPAVAILGAGRLSRDVVAVTDRIEAHRRLPLSLTFDHRCVTGGEAARFMAALIRDLERGN